MRNLMAKLALGVSLCCAAILLAAPAGSLAMIASAFTPAISITVPDNGVQPLCPRADLGREYDVHIRGTDVTFRARCDQDGPITVLDVQ